MQGVIVGKGNLSGKGVYADKDFRKGDVVIHYTLTPLTEEEYDSLAVAEKDFVHMHWGQRYLYGEPERYVNHSSDPNTLPDLKNRCDVAIKDIKRGDPITTDATKDDA